MLPLLPPPWEVSRRRPKKRRRGDEEFPQANSVVVVVEIGGGGGRDGEEEEEAKVLHGWLVEVVEESKLVSDTLYLTISYIDRFLSANAINRAEAPAARRLRHAHCLVRTHFFPHYIAKCSICSRNELEFGFVGWIQEV